MKRIWRNRPLCAGIAAGSAVLLLGGLWTALAARRERCAPWMAGPAGPWLRQSFLALRAAAVLLAAALGGLCCFLLCRWVLGLRCAADSDSLTGLGNRRCALRRARELLSGRGGCALLLVDVDRFKEINDRLGHQKGDSALQQVAAVLRNNCRAADLVCRFGGDEFLVLLPDCTAGALRAKAETLGRLLQFNVAEGGEILRVTCSLGGAAQTGPCGFDELYRRADGALLEAKRSGRNACAFDCGPSG